MIRENIAANNEIGSLAVSLYIFFLKYDNDKIIMKYYIGYPKNAKNGCQTTKQRGFS